MKDTGLRIGVQRDLRGRLVHACQVQDKPAAQLFRGFMRGYMDGRQPLLADAAPTTSGRNSKGR